MEDSAPITVCITRRVKLGYEAGRWMVGWPLLPRALVFAALMVALLTWMVMPLLTHALHNWFYPEDKRHSP